ncbi:MAG TPA: beta-ketoacyl-[acyl-carrier-protein] synthase family protein [Phycisphaerales bacterium]|nr:beta-ketoacyl-[acyl-carrier-protein] synthase family protein [Phycisphaerales bacterium]
MSRRVVITGMGWITPLGCGVESAWRALLEGRSAIGPVTRYDTSTFATNFAAEVKGFRLSDFIPDPARLAACREAGLHAQYALAAAAMAWEQSGLGTRNGEPRYAGLNARRVGVYLGAGEGCLDYPNFVATNLASWDGGSRAVDARRWAEAALSRMDVRRELEQEPNAALTHVASAFGCRGPAFNCMTACAASTQAVGEAFEMLRRGDADVMLAGGSHSMIHLLGMTGFIRLTAMSTRRETPESAARPFDQTRDGFVMGEGAGVVVLETLEHFEKRSREEEGRSEPLAELVGYGSSADAFRITDMHPEGKGPASAMSRALRQAGIDPREPREGGRAPVDYVSAHGTGTSENDSIETRAIRQVFGAQAPRLAVSSVKSMMGHLIQAAGAVELMTCVQAIRTGWLPPTMNLQRPDPECDLDYIPNRARNLNPTGGVEVCLSNSFGFGGQNDTLVVRRFRP